MAFGGGKHQCPGRSVKQLGFIYSQTLQRTTLLSWASLTLGDKVFALLFVSLLMVSIICTLFNWPESGFIPGKDRWSHNEQAESDTSVSRDIKEIQLVSAPAKVSFHQGRVASLPNTPFYRHSYLGCLKPVLNKPTKHFSGLRLSFDPLWCNWRLCWTSGILTGSSLYLVFALGHTELYNGLNCRSCLISLLQQCQPWYFLHSFCCFLCCPSSWNKSQGPSCSSFLCSNISVLNPLPSKPGLLWDKSDQESLRPVILPQVPCGAGNLEGVAEDLHSGICTLWQARH